VQALKSSNLLSSARHARHVARSASYAGRPVCDPVSCPSHPPGVSGGRVTAAALAAVAGTVTAEATTPPRNTLRIFIELVLTFLGYFSCCRIDGMRKWRPAGWQHATRKEYGSAGGVGSGQRGAWRRRNERPGAACRPADRWPPQRGFSRATTCLIADKTFVGWEALAAQVPLMSCEYCA
jgi:hypothetical protein